MHDKGQHSVLELHRCVRRNGMRAGTLQMKATVLKEVPENDGLQAWCMLEESECEQPASSAKAS